MKPSTSHPIVWMGSVLILLTTFFLTEFRSSRLPLPDAHPARGAESSSSLDYPSGLAGTRKRSAPPVVMPAPLENPQTLPQAIARLPRNEQESFQHALTRARYGIQALTPAERRERPELKGVSHHASNPSQDLMFGFLDNGGLRLQSGRVGKHWQGTLRLKGSPGDGSWKPDGIRAERTHGGITEWYVNRSEGLEHGFTLTERPATADGGPVVLHMILGELRAEDDPSREGDLVFIDPLSDEPVLGYRDLKVWDADGKQLAAEMRPGGDGFLIAVNDEGARYPVTIDPLIVSLEQAIQEGLPGPTVTLQASNPSSQFGFGGVLAVSGGTLVVGAKDEGGSGAAYVFVRNGATWSQQAYLKASNMESGDGFGTSVGISDDTIIVGAPGEDSAATGLNGNQNDSGASGAGAAYLFVRSGNVWTQQAYVKASNPGVGDGFGSSVAISGSLLVIGAPGEDSNATGSNGSQSNNSAAGSGAAYVFVRDEGIWMQQAYLKASNTGAGDGFGTTVAVSGGTVVVGAPLEDSDSDLINGTQSNNAAEDAGAAYVFVRSGSTWAQQAYLKASNSDSMDLFGTALAISDNTIVVGAIGEDSFLTGVNTELKDDMFGLGSNSGAIYIYTRSGGIWTKQAHAKNGGLNGEFGFSVALSGDCLAVGDKGQFSNGGAVTVYFRNGGNWTQQVRLTSPESSQDGNLFAASIAVSGSLIVSGDPIGYGHGSAYAFTIESGTTEDHFGLSVDVDGDTAVVGVLDHDYIFVPNTGKAWIFRRSGTTWNVEAGLVNTSPQANDRFGVAVAVSGNRVVVGADYDDEPDALGAMKVDCGSASVFERNASGTWNLLSKFSSEAAAGDSFGRAVAIDGITVVVGAPYFNSGRGRAWTYARDTGGSFWFTQAISASTPQVGAYFGFSVAVSGSTVLVGAPRTGNPLVADTGRVYFFKPGILGYWEADGEVSASQNNAQAGFSVAVDGNVAVVGCSGPTGWAGTSNDSGRTGRAFVVTHDGAAWSTTPQYLDASGLPAGSWFGMSVAVEDEVIAVGAFGNETIAGKVRVFRREGMNWVKQQDLAASGTESDNAYGVSMGLSGDTLLVGGYGADSAAGMDGGMAWIYRITGADPAIPRLTITRSGTNAILTWPVTPGWTLQRSATLQVGSWQAVTVVTDGTHTYAITSGEPRMFFRLRRP